MSAKKKSLIKSAVPSIFDIPNPPPSIDVTRKNPLDRVRSAEATEKQEAKNEGVNEHVTDIETSLSK